MDTVLQKIAMWLSSKHTKYDYIQPCVQLSECASVNTPPNIYQPMGLKNYQASNFFSSHYCPDVCPSELSKKLENLIEKNNDDHDFDKLEALTEMLSSRENEIILDKRKWEDTFNAIPDLLLIVDNDRNITQANKSFLLATGQTSETVQKLKCYDILTESTHQCTFCPAIRTHKNTACFTSHTQRIESVTIHNQYLQGTFLFSSNLITGVVEEENNSIIVLRDVSQLKETEINLARKERTLECLSRVGNYLIQNITWADAISLVLEQLVTGMNFDFSFVLRRREDNVSKFRVIDYYSDIPFDAVNLNAYLQSPGSDELTDILQSPSGSIKNPVFRTDLLSKERLRILNKFGYLGFVCVPIMIDDLKWGYLVVGTQNVPEEGYSEVDVRTIRTIAHLLCSFLVKLRMCSLLDEKDVFFHTIIDDYGCEYAFRINYESKELTYASKAFDVMLDLDPKEIIGRRMNKIFVESDDYYAEFLETAFSLSINHPVECKVFSLIHKGQMEKHQQIVRGIFDSNDTMYEVQCVGRRL